MKIDKSEAEFTYILREATGTSYPKFAILDNNNKIRHKLVRCKDYFQDVYWSEITNKNLIKQYGFEWDGQNPNPVSKQEKVNIVYIDNSNLSERANIVQGFVNCFEEVLNIPKTTVSITEDPDELFVTYDNKWSKKPHLLSFFFLMLRISKWYNGECKLDKIKEWLLVNGLNDIKSSNDRNQIMILNKCDSVEKLLNNEFIGREWNEFFTSERVHNYSGVINQTHDSLLFKYSF